MKPFSRICFRRPLAGILLAVCGLCFTGYIISDTNIYTGVFYYRLTNSQNVQGSKDTEPYDVIVLTYMRSGSSFIGKLVGYREDTFYWYEPLWNTHKWQFHSTGQMICNYGKDGCSNGTSSASSVQNSLRFLLDIYKCNLEGHFKRFSIFITGKPRFAGATGQVFQNCRFSNCNNCTSTESKCGKCPPKPVKDCYNKWMKHCNTTTHRATKVLRMDTSHAKYLLENHKRLKLIQVFRDPRAVMNSRKDTGWYYRRGNTPRSDAKVLCERMENDMASAEELKSLYPDRVKIIQYEDFYDPNRTAKILFDFLNMKMTDYVKASILAPLYVKNPKNRNGFHPDSYRYTFDPNNILFSNRYCQKVLKILGLRMFNSTEEIKNKSLSVILDKLPYPLD